MTNKTVSITVPKQSSTYKIDIGPGLLSTSGEWARNCLGQQAKRIAIISNAKVLGLYGGAVSKSIEREGFTVSAWPMKDGERYKDLRSFVATLKFLGHSNLSRTDAVIALGGGVVGDLAGFAASVYLRGVPLLQMPTTLLSMIDSSVGGKTAVNTEFGKNLVGTFYQPHGVLIDVETLRTLPARELTAGFCEAVKQGALSGRPLFDRTDQFLREFSVKGFSHNFTHPKFPDSIAGLIRSQIVFKASIVRQDEREDLARCDARSRKILNFGHTFGHALEKVTNYRYFKHGEAVGYGIIFAAELSKILEILDENEVNSLNDVVHRAGNLPSLRNVDSNEVFEAFQFDKKLIAQSLQWILLRRIGEPVILSGKDVPSAAVRKALKIVLHK